MYPRSVFAAVLAVLFCLVFFSVSHVCAQPLGILSQERQKTRAQILSASNGRFVFGQISDSDKDQFMLDTETGRLWRVAERGDIGLYLKSVPYCDSKGKCDSLPEGLEDSRDSQTKKP